MALIPCSECKKEISDEAEKCPNCGYAEINIVYKKRKRLSQKKTQL